MKERRDFFGRPPSDVEVKIDALARAMLEIAHEQELTIQQMEKAFERCKKFVLSQVVPADKENEVSQYL